MQEEVYNERDRSYSAWHRRMSTGRFVGIEKAQTLAMIDLDASLYVEYDDGTKEPLALIETARDVGQEYKNATVTRKLAARANLPCLVVLYRLSEHFNPADQRFKDICGFRIMRLNPKPENKWRLIEPKRYAELLVNMRNYKAGQLDEELWGNGL